MRIRPLMAAILAGGLLASGCDYWRNLVDDKTVTRHRLDIKVFDVWTLEPLADAECEDKERGAYPRTPDNGLITVPEAGTGLYDITCVHPQYLEGRSSFNLTSQGMQADVAMARKGGKNWYPGDINRQVQILYTFSPPLTSIRFPSRFDIHALPKDPHRRFRYIWNFSQSPALNREKDDTNAESTFYAMDASIDEVKEGKDTVTLIVMSKMKGGGAAEEYEVGRVTKVFDWVRNIPPVFDTIIDLSGQNYKVGCPGTEDRIFRFFFFAKDPDGGRCTGVRLSTRDTNTSLGKVDTFFNDCNRRSVQLPLRSIFDAPSYDTSESMVSILDVTAYDDNRESTTVELKVRTYSNILPRVTAEVRGSPAVVYTGDEVKLDYKASDVDGRIIRIITNWGMADEENEHVVYNDPIKPNILVEGTDTHIYSTPSPPERPYDITISVQDGCWVIETKVIGQLIVRDNTPPKITLHSVIRDIQDGSMSLQIQFTLEDKEVNDRFTLVKVDWGDRSDTTETADIPKLFDKTYTHLYTTPPPTSAGYKVRITVKDNHFRGTTTLDTLIAPP